MVNKIIYYPLFKNISFYKLTSDTRPIEKREGIKIAMHETIDFSSSGLYQFDLKPYGYLFSSNIIYLCDENILINYNKNSLIRIHLRKTMGNLLSFFLESSDGDFISDDEIMRRVWEDNELRASTHRLWQVMKNLRYKLIDVGMTEVIFSRTGRNGFVVNLSGVTTLYYESNIE